MMQAKNRDVRAVLFVMLMGLSTLVSDATVVQVAHAKPQLPQRPRLLDRLRQQESPQDGTGRMSETRPRLLQPGGLLGERPNSDQPLGDRLSNLVDAVEKRIEMGQRIAGMFGGTPSAQIVSTEALIGQTYNVGHVVYRLTPEDSLRWQTRAIFVSDPENRVLYPSLMPTFLQRLGSQFTDKPTDPPQDIDIWFVFVGRQPLHLTIHAAQDHRLTIEPANLGRVRQNAMLQSWWRQFELMLKEQVAASDYPPLVQAYLETMIQQRMGLAESGLLPPPRESQVNPLTETWNLLTSAESLQVDNLKAMMRDKNLQLQPANQPLPANIAWQPHQFDKIDPNVQVEPIAMCVPQECFYLRFGNWSNQVWLKQLMDEHGGDLGRMVRLRGYQSLVGDLFRDQLAMESSQLDDLFGGTLIQDVAVIGLDTFLSEGAAAGLVLHSRNGLLLSSLSGKRQDYATKNAAWGVTLNELKVGETPATILQSPDGRVRSILVSAGDFHLVTTSYTLAQRFLQAAAGHASLGQSDEFRQARSQMPLTRDDTIFAYLSTAFLENMLSPQYQIELRRRQRSITEIQMLQMATWSAAAHQIPVPGGYADWEQVPLELRIQALTETGFLPNNFNRRADASQVGLMPVPKKSVGEVAPGEIGSVGNANGTSGAAEAKGGTNLLNSVVGSLFGGRKIGNANDGTNVQPATDLSVPVENPSSEVLPLPNGQPATAISPPPILWKELPLGDSLYGDTLRGVRGWMIPVADMRVDRVTAEESLWYQERAKYFETQWRQTDPLMIGVKRFARENGIERVVFDARVAPFASQRYGWLMERIGPPLSVRPAPNPEDVIRLELSMAPSAFLPNVPAHLLFAAVQRDAQQLQNLDPSEWWTTLKLLQSTPGYIATWPAAGLLNMFPMLAGKPDEQGFTRSPALGIVRLQYDGFSAIAVDRERLERLKPQLQMVEAETPAQARLEIGDLAQSQLEAWVNTLWRQRSWQASLANTRMLHLLMQHFHLEPGTAKQKAQSLLNAELVCSLDGNYMLWGPEGLVGDIAPEATWVAPLPPLPGTEPGGTNEPRNFEALPALPPPPPQPVAAATLHPFSYYWVSDHWPTDGRVAAQAWGEETSPLLSWFRGAMIEANQEESRFLLHGYLDINRKETDKEALPSLNLFEGFSWK
ncbi:MAG: hypothetical protein JNL67_12950 [Planctomycetaceae bacterium]|nr:hypothetical protein [Planctomycetaceae bacterium]